MKLIKLQFKDKVMKRELLDWYIEINTRQATEVTISELIKIAEEAGVKVQIETKAEMVKWASKCKAIPQTKEFIERMTSEEVESILNKDIMHDMYWKEGRTITQIANQLGAPYQTAYTRFIMYGIPTRPNKGKQSKVSKEEVWELFNQGMTRAQIAECLGVGTTTINRRINQMKSKISA
ncbi:hypothetical protein KQI86_19105 [Clostridium sp. MSJ-11]|uniref:Uncharacterized protein n=1 Tax=Clostridium mobile TaxID=2841512 RepID=A0ABS6ENS0_9CLOT|nr:hypothetical protein [Clostridium mobile]MBU5486412.1 hypothetical protein [Clostridium mobile]